MNNTYCLVLSSLFIGLIATAHAENDDDLTRSLTMKCEYSDNKSFQNEDISISQTTVNQGQPASVMTFKRGSTQQEVKTFLVKPGQFAECIYPSGTHVRVKVGEGTSHPYGMCGGNPEVFMSLWVNKRKIASRVWFAGHCSEDAGLPAVSFKVSGGSLTSVEKCHSTKQPESTAAPDNGASEQVESEPFSVCVDYPEISNYSRDYLEYPLQGKLAPKDGDIELLKGSDAVCNATLVELKNDFYSFGSYPDQTKIRLSRPNWSETTMELPDELAGSSESIFDFDNDGKLDRVFARSFETTYMDGSILLVQPGRSSTILEVSDPPMDKSSVFLPCQIDTSRIDIRDCPPFSQKNDEAGFSMKGKTDKDLVSFRARYSNVTPFSFQGANFIGLSSKSEDTKDYVAVLKPLPNGKFQKKCLLRRITENF